MIDKSKLATGYGFALLALLAIGLILGYVGTIVLMLSGTQWDEGITVAIAIILVMAAIQEYLHL